MRKFYLTIISFIVTCVFLFANTNELDSLKNALQNNKRSDSTRIKILFELSDYYKNVNQDISIHYAKQVLDLSKKINYNSEINKSYIRISELYRMQGDYDSSLHYSFELLKESEKSKDLMHNYMASLMIANVFFRLSEYDKALDYMNKSLEICKEIGDSIGLSKTYNSIGNVYYGKAEYNKSLEYYIQSLEIKKQLLDSSGMSNSLHNIGFIYEQLEQYDKALQYYEESLKICIQAGLTNHIAASYLGIANIHIKSQDYNAAKQNLEQAYISGSKHDEKLSLSTYYLMLSELDLIQKDYISSLKNYKTHVAYKDSLYNIEKSRLIEEMSTKYETEKKEREIELLNNEKKVQAFEIKRQKLIRNFALVVLVFFIISLLTLYSRYRYKQKMNLILETQNQEITNKNKQIEKQKKNITDSIKYAHYIQETLHPTIEDVNTILSNNFIFYKPRDIVSGDFYWVSEQNNKKYIAIADCTGHGVPGAFMSLLGMSYMNEILSKKHELKANEILNLMRDMVITSLKQNNQASELRDGIDMALCIYDAQKKVLEYAGANNPLYLIRNNKITEYEPDLMPIGTFHKMKDSFQNQTIEVQQNDIIYMFTDGFIDQFGGKEYKRYGSVAFKDLILEIHAMPFKVQKDLLLNRLKSWQKDHEQIDDILIMGFSFI